MKIIFEIFHQKYLIFTWHICKTPKSDVDAKILRSAPKSNGAEKERSRYDDVKKNWYVQLEESSFIII